MTSITTPADAPIWWLLVGVTVLTLAAILHWRRWPTKTQGWVERNERPGLYWTGVAIVGVWLFVNLFLALMASIDWPPGM